MNIWSGIGNVGSDPVLRRTGSGKAVLNFSIAVDRLAVIITPEGPVRHKECDWIPIVVFGDAAEHQAIYLQKGTKIGVTGALRPREWVDREGNKHTGFEIQANTIEWLANVKGFDRKSSNDSASVSDS